MPVLVYGVVGSDDGDRLSVASSSGGPSSTPGGDAEGEGGGDGGEVRSGGGTSEADTTTTTTAEPTTTTAEPEEADDSTTTTAAPTATAAPEEEAEPTTTTAPPSRTAVDEVLDLVNEVREAASCEPVEVDEHLEAAARLHSEDMSARAYLDHLTPEGQDPVARAQAQGYTGAGVGENIAQGFPNAQTVMEGWMDSEGHRSNIENCDYRYVGIAVAPNGWYWTQVFGL